MPIVIQHNLSPIVGGLAAYRAGKSVGAQQIAGYKAAQQQQIGGALASGVQGGFQAAYGRQTQQLLQQGQISAATAARNQAAQIEYNQHLQNRYGMSADQFQQGANEVFGGDTHEYTRFLDKQRGLDETDAQIMRIKALAPVQAEAAGQLDAARYTARYKAEYDERQKYAEELAQQGLLAQGIRTAHGNMLDANTEVVAEFSPKQLAAMSEIHNMIEEVKRNPDFLLHPEEQAQALQDLYENLGSFVPTTRYKTRQVPPEEDWLNSSVSIPGTRNVAFKETKKDGSTVWHTVKTEPHIPDEVNKEWVNDIEGNTFKVAAEEEYKAMMRDRWTADYNALPLAERQKREGGTGKKGKYSFDDYAEERFQMEQPRFTQFLMQKRDARRAELVNGFTQSNELAEKMTGNPANRMPKSTPPSAGQPSPQQQAPAAPEPPSAPPPAATEMEMAARDPVKVAQAAAIVAKAPKKYSDMTKAEYDDLVRAATIIKLAEKAKVRGNSTPQPAAGR